MTVQVLDAADVRARLSVSAAADALAARLRHDPPAHDRPARTRVDTRAGQVLLMPDESGADVGVKIVSIARGNPARGLPAIQGSYLLLDADTLTPRAVLDAAELTLLRTSAVSLLGVRLLGPLPRPRVTVVGAGPQAIAHLRAMATLDPAVLRLSVRDASRVDAARAALIAAAPDLDVDVVVGVPGADSDVVVCTTTAREPVFDSRVLPDHAVVVAMGSHEPDVRELDTALMARGWVVVESRDVARREAGDLVIAEAETGRGLVAADLGELVRGEAVPDPARPRVLKTVGEAWEDLTVAAAVLASAAG
jgi:ornithine cyclodeaminase/alanine dehydrogenase-like protein (mu-crystallin family)